MSQQNNQDIDKDSEDRISALEAAVWNHSAGNGQAYLIDAAKGRLRKYHHIYRKALADAIRRPMGVIPDSAIGLIDHDDLAAAESRRDAPPATAPSDSSQSSCSALVEAISEMNRHIEVLSLKSNLSPQLDRASEMRAELVAALVEVKPNAKVSRHGEQSNNRTIEQ